MVAQVISRYAEAEQIASGLVGSVLRRIAGSVPAGGWAVVNPSPVDRHELVELDLAVPATWPSVAVRVGDRVLPTQELVREGAVHGVVEVRGSDVAGFLRRRRHGRELLGRYINASEVEATGTPPRIVVHVDRVAEPPELDVEELVGSIVAAAEARPDDVWEVTIEVTKRRRVLARLPAPALGYGWATELEGDTLPVEAIPHPVEGHDRTMRNGLVEVTVADDGTFRLTGGGVSLDGVGRIVEGGDAGDSYNYGPPAADRLVDQPDLVDIRSGASGPLRAELTIIRTYAWPRGLSADTRARSERTAETEVTTTLELRADEPFVRVSLAFDNDSSDHRVRFHIPLPAAVTGSAAEGQFAVVERGLEQEGGHGEVPLATFPALGFASVEGCSVLLDQVTEYEVIDGRELALTVLRSFGLISRNSNPYREDPAGPEVEVPAAQLLGTRAYPVRAAAAWRGVVRGRHAGGRGALSASIPRRPWQRSRGCPDRRRPRPLDRWRGSRAQRRAAARRLARGTRPQPVRQSPPSHPSAPGRCRSRGRSARPSGRAAGRRGHGRDPRSGPVGDPHGPASSDRPGRVLKGSSWTAAMTRVCNVDRTFGRTLGSAHFRPDRTVVGGRREAPVTTADRSALRM